MKKLILSSLLVSMFSASSIAAETTTIDISADIPSDEFHFRPVAAITGTQDMHYNQLTKSLSGLSYDFSYKVGATKAISATMNTSAVLTNGTNDIPLTVAVGGVALTAGSPEEVVAKDDTNPQSGVTKLTIEPTTATVDNTNAANVGTYTGTVEIVFDAS
ncbi:CS1 type fimbrial major subunit [Vibrio owensii]|uniref:CS1 type fimbrial major subunit n=1 Tax=Vibrio owensii TaxID=696485 RepID=UPI00289451E2|nr:conserved exported hypothetical protein [Vibrio owensii]